MITLISCQDLAGLMASEELYAVFDGRERGEFNQCQIPNATSLPRSQIEFRIADLVPNRAVPIVMYDEGGERARLAAEGLSKFGYARISILDGGFHEWRREGRSTVSGVNVPSKAFGERVHHESHIPDISPQELKELLDGAIKPIILDVRTPEEYGRFCIPGGQNVPGGDLILWADELDRRRESPIIINCAGRTRSIIGTAALQRLGLTHVRGLRNGTMGWVLAGFNLEIKPARQASSAPAVSRNRALALAARLIDEEKIPKLSPLDVSSLTENAHDGVTYLIDVRSEAEYETGHIANSLNVPGGQAVQRADDFVAVRNAEIVFISDHAARAAMAAYWYRRMGFLKVHVLDGGLDAWTTSGGKLVAGSALSEPLGIGAAKRAARYIDMKVLNERIADSSVLVLDVGTSLDYEAGHVPGARWITRGWIEIKLPQQFTDRNQSIVVTCPDGAQSTFAATTLTEIGYTDVSVLENGVHAWLAAGLPTEKGLDGCLVEPNDVVLSPSIRGDKEAMQRYLDWETKLPH